MLQMYSAVAGLDQETSDGLPSSSELRSHSYLHLMQMLWAILDKDWGWWWVMCKRTSETFWSSTTRVTLTASYNHICELVQNSNPERLHCNQFSELEGSRHCVGGYGMQGSPSYQEDYFMYESNEECVVACVFDGHGGDQAAMFSCDKLVGHLKAHLEKENGVPDALHKSFQETNCKFLDEFAQDSSGTCGLVAVVKEGLLHIAHAGDCRAVLCSGAHCTATRLTNDHKPDLPNERRHIEGAGGYIKYKRGCWRVSASSTSVMLACSRTIGDRAFKVPHTRPTSV